MLVPDALFQLCEEADSKANKAVAEIRRCSFCVCQGQLVAVGLEVDHAHSRYLGGIEGSKAGYAR